MWSTGPQATVASVPFGNFWKAVIFGVVALQSFFKLQALEKNETKCY